MVYVDESGVEEYYQRDYGRAAIGTSVEDCKRGKRFARNNVVAGLLGQKHFAVQTYNHATTTVIAGRRWQSEHMEGIDATPGQGQERD